jgi:hypothetical protein
MIRKKTESDGPIPIKLVREPFNVHDDNAIKVVILDGPYKGMHIGYLPRGIAKEYAQRIDEKRITIENASMPIVNDEDGDGEIVVTVVHTKKKSPATKRISKKSAKRA